MAMTRGRGEKKQRHARRKGHDKMTVPFKMTCVFSTFLMLDMMMAKDGHYNETKAGSLLAEQNKSFTLLA
jgi:hypothetical protein